MSRFERFVAIDWSGAVGAVQRGIAVAVCSSGSGAPQLVRAEGGWSREAALEWLVASLPERSLVGLDLGMSLPFADRGAFFPEWPDSPGDARGLWKLVDTICVGDANLAASAFVDHPEASRHFRRHGGRVGDLFGAGRGRLRVTERHQQAQGLSPYSNLNLVGAAQVGKSSLTGMRILHRLRGHVPIWPFDAPGDGSVVLEIYTTIAAIAAGRPRGRSKMKTIAALDAALTASAIGSDPVGGVGDIDDHRSDAILTAAWLRANADRGELWRPAAMTPQIAATEGWTFGVA